MMNTQMFYDFGRIRSANYCPEFMAVVNIAIAQGFELPSFNTLNQMNALMVGMLGINYFQTRSSFACFANGLTDPGFSRIDWTEPVGAKNYQITGGLIKTVNGFEGNAVNAYLSQTRNLQTDAKYQLNSGMFAVTVYKANSAGNSLVGSATASIRLTNSSSNALRINSSTTATLNAAADMSGLGYTSMIRDSATAVRLYKRENEYLRTQASSLVPSGPAYFLRSVSSYGDAGLSHIDYGAPVSQAQVVAFRNLFNQYLSNIDQPAIA